MRDFSMPINIVNIETGEIETHQAYVKENSKRYVKSGLIKIYPEVLESKYVKYIKYLINTINTTGSIEIIWNDVFKDTEISYMQISRIKKQWLKENIIYSKDKFRVYVNPYTILRQTTFSEQIQDQIKWDYLVGSREINV